LPRSTHAETYANTTAFLHASADDVVDEAVVYIFAKDRNSLGFLRVLEAGRVAPNVHIRCAA
jgi:hypothetical protein